jgi:hypothetical protein
MPMSRLACKSEGLLTTRWRVSRVERANLRHENTPFLNYFFVGGLTQVFPSIPGSVH